MEVAGRPYSQGRGVLAVHMDGEHALPPLDLALLQVLSSAVVCSTSLPPCQPLLLGARLPPHYTERDEWGSVRWGPLAPGPLYPPIAGVSPASSVQPS